MHILVTGHAGFIGNHLAHRLLQDGHQVTGIDNLNDYYDVGLKQARLDRLRNLPGFTHVAGDLADADAVMGLFGGPRVDAVVNLAAQAGVRYSLENPQSYINSNIQGFQNILEACREYKPGHLIFASTSSVYGANTHMPFSTDDHTDHPLTLYAATKKANEVMAHSYAHLYGIPVTGLRFFTVYGPWGRPDMAPMKFAARIMAGTPIDVYNAGDMARDFTYVGDIVEGIAKLLEKPPAIDPHWNSAAPSPASSGIAPYKLYNIGSNSPTRLLDFIETLEDCLGRKAQRNNMPMQPGDVPATWANVEDLFAATGYRPQTSLKDGVQAFVDWYLDYYAQD